MLREVKLQKLSQFELLLLLIFKKSKNPRIKLA